MYFWCGNERVFPASKISCSESHQIFLVHLIRLYVYVAPNKFGYILVFVMLNDSLPKPVVTVLNFWIKQWTLRHVGSSWPLRDRLLVTAKILFYPTWLVTLKDNASWRYFSQCWNCQTLWVYRTPGTLRFTSFTLFFLPSLYGFSAVNRYVSRQCSWKDERDVQMFWTRAKVLAVCYSSQHRSRQRCLLSV